MLADSVGAGLRFVGCSAGGIGSCCTKGCVAGLPVKVAHIVGSGGGAEVGAIVWKGTNGLAVLFLDVKTVTAPAAAPIFIMLLLLRWSFLPGVFFASFLRLAMMLSLRFTLHASDIPSTSYKLILTSIKMPSLHPLSAQSS